MSHCFAVYSSRQTSYPLPCCSTTSLRRIRDCPDATWMWPFLWFAAAWIWGPLAEGRPAAIDFMAFVTFVVKFEGLMRPKIAKSLFDHQITIVTAVAVEAYWWLFIGWVVAMLLMKDSAMTVCFKVPFWWLKVVTMELQPQSLVTIFLWVPSPPQR